MIIEELHKIQHHHGHLPKTELVSLSRRIQVPLYRLQEVASFFPHFKLEPPPGVEVLVCHDMSCHLRGSAEILRDVRQQLTEPQRAEIKFVSCLGRCDRAPAACVAGDVVVQQTAESLCKTAEARRSGAPAICDRDIDLPRQSPEPWLIDPYDGEPTYGAIRQFAEHRDPKRVLEALKIADLRGMGGAGVWAHQKWSDVARAKGDAKYIVCNGDESEPGTFKDRELLLRTPHVVLEGVILAGLLTGATRGYIYIRHEYQEQIVAMKAAIAKAEKMKVCGRQILNTGIDFPVEVFQSPGGYICGEQSALIEAMEDRRAQPRNKPPLLETNGLYDKPTLVSNVETFGWVPAIIVKGAPWYAGLGRPGFKGARFFSISGDLKRPGAYEVPNGITLRELIMDFAGGMSDGQSLKAVAMSGPSGGFMPARLPVEALSRSWKEKLPPATVEKMLLPDGKHVDLLEVELDLQRSRDLGIMLGAGLVVYGDRTDLVSEALNCGEFFRNESCGKCVPCRIGSQKLVELSEGIVARRTRPDELEFTTSFVKEVDRVLELTSICGLGAVAGKPLATLLRFFRQDVERYLSSNGAKVS